MQVFMIIDREIIMEKLATYYGKWRNTEIDKVCGRERFHGEEVTTVEMFRGEAWQSVVIFQFFPWMSRKVGLIVDRVLEW